MISFPFLSRQRLEKHIWRESAQICDVFEGCPVCLEERVRSFVLDWRRGLCYWFLRSVLAFSVLLCIAYLQQINDDKAQ